jgi:hypothetical protein
MGTILFWVLTAFIYGIICEFKLYNVVVEMSIGTRNACTDNFTIVVIIQMYIFIVAFFFEGPLEPFLVKSNPLWPWVDSQASFCRQT